MRLSLMRRLRLLCGLLQHAALSFLWMRLNMLTFIHYFPRHASLDFLLFSYVFCFPFCFISLEHHVLLPQSLSPLPVRLDPSPRPPLGFHFSTFPPQISEHSFAIYGIAGLLLFHVSSVVNYLVSPVFPFSLVLHRVIDRFAVPSRSPLLLSLLRTPRRSLRFHVSTFPR